MRNRLLKLTMLLAVVGLWASITVNAAFTGTQWNPASGQNLSASASFTIDGDQLEVRVSNDGGPSTVNSDVLTAVLFSVSGATITPILGSMTYGGFDEDSSQNSPTLGDQIAAIGGNWSYESGLTMPSGRFTGANAGISSTGLGIFAAQGGARFGTPSVELDGPSYGIAGTPVSANSDPFLLSYATFKFTIAPLPDQSLEIGNVYFQWGTSLSEPASDTPPVPEPTTILAGLLLLLPFGASAIRIMRKNRS